MIGFDTYITILFSIVIPAIGVFIAIISGKYSYYKKRDLLFILFFISFVLIVISTLLYCYGRYLYLPDLLPFTKPQFSDIKFRNLYILLFFFPFIGSLCACIEIVIIGRRINDIYITAVHDIKYIIITLLFHIFISTYIHLWITYVLCFLTFNYITISAITIFFIILIFIEASVFYSINKYLTFRKIAKKDGKY